MHVDMAAQSIRAEQMLLQPIGATRASLARLLACVYLEIVLDVHDATSNKQIARLLVHRLV